MAHVRERPPLRETVELVTPSGKRYRWSDDEPAAANVPTGDRWSDTIPGGFETHDLTLPRKPGIDYGDMERLSRLTRYDAAGNIIWQGRLERAPRVWGDQIAVTPAAVGYQAHLDDDKSVRFLGRDISLSRWEPPAAGRRVSLSGSNTPHTTDPMILPDATNSRAILRLEFEGAWASPFLPRCEAWYDAGAGLVVDSMYYDFDGYNNASFRLVAMSADTDDATDETTADLYTNATGTGSGTYTPATARQYVAWAWDFTTTPAGTAGERYWVDIRDLAVYGDHGLTLRGTEPDAGFYDADLIGYALSQWCPLLRYTDESLTSSTLVIGQFAFHDPATVGELVRQATRFELRDWAVWDDLTFWLYDRGTVGRSWRARVGPAKLEETGPQVDRVWNSIMVAYQDADGRTRTVGPPGSGADTESDDLVDEDPENPANKVGITRRDLLTVGRSNIALATSIGARFLEESKSLDSSGRATLVGYVEDDRGVIHPYSHVRAGDTIVFEDAADTSARRIIRTDKNRGNRTCTIDIDAPPEGLQALLERLDAGLVTG